MINLIFKLIFNLLRTIFNKIIYGCRYNVDLIERFSIHTSIRLFGSSQIILGRNIELSPYVDIQVHRNGCLKLGGRVYMNRYCMISCHGSIEIGSGCMFGPGVRIFDNNHKFYKGRGVSTELNAGEIKIGKNCWISSNAVILKGANIGDNCVIGAGCIIDSMIPPNSLVKISQNITIEKLK